MRLYGVPRSLPALPFLFVFITVVIAAPTKTTKAIDIQSSSHEISTFNAPTALSPKNQCTNATTNG